MEAEAKPRVHAGRSPAQEAGTSSGAEPGPSDVGASAPAERRHPGGKAALTSPASGQHPASYIRAVQTVQIVQIVQAVQTVQTTTSDTIAGVILRLCRADGVAPQALTRPRRSGRARRRNTFRLCELGFARHGLEPRERQRPARYPEADGRPPKGSAPFGIPRQGTALDPARRRNRLAIRGSLRAPSGESRSAPRDARS